MDKTRTSTGKRVKTSSKKAAPGKRPARASGRRGTAQRTAHDWQALVETSAAWIWETDTDLHHVYTNAFVTTCLGYRPAEFLKLATVDLIHPDDRTVVNELVQNAATRREGWTNTVLRWRHKDGSWRYIESSGVPVFDQKSNFVGLRGVDRDITDRRKAEADLRASVDRFRTLFENLSVVALVIDPTDGSILDANGAAAAYYGWPQERLRSMNIARINTLSLDEIGVRMQEVKDRKRGFFLLRHRRADGSVRDVEVHSGPIIFEGKTALYSIIHDVTERKEAEEALKQSEDRFRKAYDTSPDSININRLADGRYVSINRGFTRITGYSEPEVIGRTSLELNIWDDPEDRSRLVEAISAKGEVSNLEARFRTKQGGIRYGLMSASVIEIDGDPHVLSVTRDITDRKLMEQQLRESENRLNTILDNVGAYIFIKDTQYRYTYVNGKVSGLFGVSVKDILGKGDDAFFSPASVEAIMESDRPVIEHGETVARVEAGLASPGSMPRTYWTVKLPLRDSSGTITGLCGISTDITERMRTEEALQRNERMLQAIIDAEPECVKVLDENANVIMMNRAGLDMIQVDGLDQVKGQCICPLVTSEYRGAFMDLTRRVFQGQSGSLVFGVVGVKGRRLLLETNAVPLRNEKNRIVALLGVTRDITERKLAEEALRENQARLDLALLSAHMGVWRWEIKGDRRYFDDLTCQLLGIDALTFTGRAEEFFRVVHPEDREKVKAALARTLEHDVPYEPDYRAVWPDGSIHYITARGRLIRDDDGAPARINGILWDVTEQHLIAEERLKAQKLESIGTLAGGIAHDFNNLLQGVFGYISMAKLLFEQREKSFAMLEQAEKALHQSVDLTSQLLTFSKGGRPVKKLIDLRPVIENAAKFALSGSRTDYRLTVEDGLWSVEADTGQIGQVIQNIVLNADQAMPEGGTIEIAAQNVPAGTAAALQGVGRGNYVEISIRDSGIGIQGRHLAKIFDPYFTTKEKGSGLGLATSYSIVKNHGGLIAVSSEPGKGSLFRVYLPASANRPEPMSRSGTMVSGRNGRVLVMDDEELVRKVAGDLLRELGHDVELAEHGEAAIEKFRQARQTGRPFDIVILDLTVRGGMGGAEAVRRLLAIDPTVKAVVTSGYSDTTITADFQDHGFRAFLRKPYDTERLKEVVSRLMA